MALIRNLAVAASLSLLACGERPAPAPSPITSAPAAVAPSREADLALQASRYARLHDSLRRIRAEERQLRQAAFEEEYDLYLQILRNFDAPESSRAAWQWITTAWDVPGASSDPGELAWDGRTATVGMFGTFPRTFTVSLGQEISIDLVWMDPGIFWMGSPSSETGHNADEAQHQTMAAAGFWMGAFEVTQELWTRVMGKNPSYFTAAGGKAPVEQVSWLDAQVFLLKLNTLVEKQPFSWIGAMFRLPEEAEWEYACRAGTTTPIYTGSFKILADNHAPELDAIAWYGGNCGVTYAGGWDSSKWRGMQYPHTRAGTHPVGAKQPNAWGLYDMIGNVWEWCATPYAPYGEAPPDEGFALKRVARGASWGNLAGACRAAIRNPMAMDARHNRVGFRVAASW